MKTIELNIARVGHKEMFDSFLIEEFNLCKNYHKEKNA